jgi:apolipoprotein N-acyltransferase
MKTKLSFLLSYFEALTLKKIICLAFIASFGLSLSTPPYNLYILEFFAFLPGFYLFHPTQSHLKSYHAFMYGYILSFFAFCFIFPWLVSTIQIFGGFSYTLTVILFIIYNGIMAIKMGLLFYIPHKLKKKYNYPVLMSFIFSNLLLESLFPEVMPFYLGNGQLYNTYFVQIADIIGVKGISLAVLMVSYFLYQSLLFKNKRKLLILCIILFTAYSYSFFRFIEIYSVTNRKKIYKNIHIGIIQPNLDFQTDPLLIQRDNNRIKELTNNLIENAKSPFDLIVWPESTVPFNILGDFDLARQTRSYIDSLNVPLMYNALVNRYDKSGQLHVYSDAILHTPSLKGKALENQYFSKIQRIPFGEFVPLADLFPSLQNTIKQAGDLSKGDKIINFKLKDIWITPQICYEITSPTLTQQFMRKGSKVIVNLTNDKWFGNTKASSLHLWAASFRAIENRVILIRAANSGISTVIGIKGLPIIKNTSLFKEASVDATIQVYNKMQSIYRYLGDYPLDILVIYLFIMGFYNKEITNRPRIFNLFQKKKKL